MLYEHYIGFLNTPPLWKNEQFGICQFQFPTLKLNEFTSRPIPDGIRLGHQVEQVFKQLLEYSPNYEILVENLPIRKGNRTIGEIDFVLREIETEQIIHVELTYKFYIIDTSISEPIHRLIGPNRRDMFFTKMEKIKNHQFPLLHAAEGVEILHQNGIDHQILEHQCCFKAQLFAPYDSASIHIRPLNKTCIYGFWLRFDDFNTAKFQSCQYYIPFKSEWVVAPHNGVVWQSHYEILMEINMRMLKKNSPMVWMKKSETHFEKFFVVWW